MCDFNGIMPICKHAFMENCGLVPKSDSKLNMMEDNLNRILEGYSPNQDIFPPFSKYWDELSLEEAENCSFHRLPLLESWIIIGKETIKANKSSKLKRRTKKAKIIYNWEARTTDDCVKDLKTLCKELGDNLNSRYINIVPSIIENLSKIFDLGEIVNDLTKFKFQNEKLIIGRNDRVKWERTELEEFNMFHEHVCQLPHEQKYVDEHSNSNLLPHYSQSIFIKFKETIKKIVWENFGDETSKIFRTKKDNA